MIVLMVVLAWVLVNATLTLLLAGMMDAEICGWDDLLWVMVMSLASPAVVIAVWHIVYRIKNRRN